ncbi:MAG: metallophosphoesterase family protein [Actinobacteria bacterium]|nr:metallophosphoesterase family protein [Actinomycetota bacterium]MBW3646183.1 metallophosphoesterase family protein [Actinomycetota bacterium]
MRPWQLLPLGAAAAWPFVEPHLPVLRRLAVPALAPDDQPIRVLHLSDLHLLARHRRRAAWVRALTRHSPDLVVSTGDHWSSAEALDLLTTTLGALTADGTPAVFVPGNNDCFTPRPPLPLGYLRGRGSPVRRREDLPWGAAVSALEGVGWTDLTQRRLTLQVAGRPLTLTGTDDAHLRRDRYTQVAGPVAGFGLGVTHTPARRLLRRFAADGHALVLAGHTHGGQLRLPGKGALVTNCDLERARARGLSRLDAGEQSGGWLHVSAGLGTSPYAPVRLCCRPEASLLELVPASRVR